MKVVLGRESDASHIQQQKRLRKAQREAEAVVAAAEEAVAGRIATVEADLAANIAEMERVCEEERQAAANAAVAYVEMNNPKADEAAKAAAGLALSLSRARVLFNCCLIIQLV